MRPARAFSLRWVEKAWYALEIACRFGAELHAVPVIPLSEPLRRVEVQALVNDESSPTR